MFYVYILYNPRIDKFYVGSTVNLENRLKNHNEGKSRYTKAGAPNWVLVYTEEFNTRSKALKREYAIKKKKSKDYIKWLVGT